MATGTRGRYVGMLAGDEKNQSSVSEHDMDNETVEGREAAKLRGMLSRRDWAAVKAYMEQLSKEGWSTVRLQCVSSRASMGLRF